MGEWIDDRWMDGWINRMWSISTVEYYVALKRSEALTQATARMDLEHEILSEGSRPCEEQITYLGVSLATGTKVK